MYVNIQTDTVSLNHILKHTKAWGEFLFLLRNGVVGPIQKINTSVKRCSHLQGNKAIVNMGGGEGGGQIKTTTPSTQNIEIYNMEEKKKYVWILT